MALCTDAAMVLFFDIAGDTAEHGDWLIQEHLHERLSIPGFERASRWTATDGAATYMIVYEVSNIEIAISPDYLARLNNPSRWTMEMMPRFRGMTRGFVSIVASSGFGYGNTALSVRFNPSKDQEVRLGKWLTEEILPAMASLRGMGSIYVMRPAPTPPMTKEQALRGTDTPLSWLVLATAFEKEALKSVGEKYFSPQILEDFGVSSQPIIRTYSLNYIANAEEVGRTSPRP